MDRKITNPILTRKELLDVFAVKCGYYDWKDWWGNKAPDFKDFCEFEDFVFSAMDCSIKSTLENWIKNNSLKKANLKSWKRAEYNLRLREKQVARLEKKILKKDREIKQFLRFLRNTNWFSEPQIQQLSYIIKRVNWNE